MKSLKSYTHFYNNNNDNLVNVYLKIQVHSLNTVVTSKKHLRGQLLPQTIHTLVRT